jgi:hypothetical protein
MSVTPFYFLANHLFLDQQNEQVDDFDVYLLNPVSVAEVRDANFDIGLTGQFATVLTRQQHNLHALLASSFNGADNIARIAAGAQAEQYVAFVA